MSNNYSYQIMQLLRDTEGDFVSGQKVSSILGITRSSIWKHIELLRKEGYVIDAVSHKGYVLRSVPDALIPRELQYNLKTKHFGRQMLYHLIIDSTMPEAFKLGRQGKAEGYLVCTEKQTKGKGRFNRHWSSPEGGLYFSLLLRPKVDISRIGLLPLLISVGICDAINEFTEIKPNIKWPNDIIVYDKKLAGILLEIDSEIDQISFVVVGVGLNVNTIKSRLPTSAISLQNIIKKKVSRLRLLQEILFKLEELYYAAQKNGFKDIIENWRQYSITLGKNVRIKDVYSNTILEGKAIDINEYGGLIIQTKSGKKITRMSGDVTIC